MPRPGSLADYLAPIFAQQQLLSELDRFGSVAGGSELLKRQRPLLNDISSRPTRRDVNMSHSFLGAAKATQAPLRISQLPGGLCRQ